MRLTLKQVEHFAVSWAKVLFAVVDTMQLGLKTMFSSKFHPGKYTLATKDRPEANWRRPTSGEVPKKKTFEKQAFRAVHDKPDSKTSRGGGGGGVERNLKLHKRSL